MFLEATADYTDSEVIFAKQNQIVFQIFVKDERNFSTYSENDEWIVIKNSSVSSFFENSNSRTNDEDVKLQMFKISSGALAKSLK